MILNFSERKRNNFVSELHNLTCEITIGLEVLEYGFKSYRRTVKANISNI